MGWASGSEIAQKLWNKIEQYLPEKVKKELALDITNFFESEDCDTMQECDFVNKYLVYDDDKNDWRIKC